MSQVNIHEAKTHLSRPVERAARGEEIVIARAGKPVARLAGMQPVQSRRRFGALRGKARVDARFFEPLPEEELAGWEPE